jgi:hypothetical protein
MRVHLLFSYNVLTHLVASMSGFVSFCLAIYEAAKGKKFETWAFFVIGAICLIVAFDQSWQDEHRNAEVLIAEKSALTSERDFWKAQNYDKDSALRQNQNLLSQNYGALIGEQTTANKSQQSLADLSGKILALNQGCYHPDRHLSDEDRAVIFHAAQEAFKAAKKETDNPTIQFRSFEGDSESSRFWQELWPLFRNAGWGWPTVTPPPPPGPLSESQIKEQQKIYEEQKTWLFQHGHMTGVSVFDTKKSSAGWYITAALSERKMGNMASTE